MTEEFKTKHITYNQAAVHVDRFLALRCAVDLLSYGLFPNGKEISESMAAWWAIRQYVTPNRIDESDGEVAVVVVGDGTKPRTAALIAHMTKWQCFSVDPLLKDTEYPNIDRLVCYKSKIENIRLDLYRRKHVIIVGVHSHASTRDITTGVLYNKADFVMIPCCVWQEPMSNTVVLYKDEAIWSPKNDVVVSLDATHPLSRPQQLADAYYTRLYSSLLSDRKEGESF